MYPPNYKRRRGFTLVEVAIVLLIVAIILGYSVALFPVQQRLKQYRSAEAEMDRIVEQLVAFAQVNGRLPCPDTGAGALTPDGLEDIDAGPPVSCTAFFGFVPARTLGMNGNFDAAGVMLDPWGAGYGYAVSDIDSGLNTNKILVTANEIRTQGIAAVQPDLFICTDNTNAVANETDCVAPSGAEVMGSNGEVAAVIISLGLDNTLPATSNVQAENVDNFDDGTLDKVYIFSSQRDDYDDIVKWVPTNLLISRMIEAEQLP
ncbi:MAG: type II secretion system protein [Gammaproteobacteria bacterium]|nr:type II secretion system protein [Gammaproteobacteria bacterium]